MPEQIVQHESVVPVMKLEKLYYAVITKDDETGVEFGTPKYLEGVREFNFKPKMIEGKYYHESKLTINNNIFSEAEVEIDITDIPKTQRVELFGNKVADKGLVLESTTDKAIDVALIVKTIKSNGKARYTVIFKCNFAPADESLKQVEDKLEYSSGKYKIISLPLKYNGVYKGRAEEEDGYTDATMFAEVPQPVEKTIAVT